MAIFSCSHSTVGRTTHAAGTAGAHARYVTRDSAARAVVGDHMPLDREAARTWLDGQEEGDRKNARVIDKVMVALPRELDAAERLQLVRDFAAEVGGNRIPWLAGIHDQGKDAGNPHAHVIFRDRDHETGKRVAGLSEKGSTEQLRQTWERVCNQALERAGHDARIDHRSLAAQGSAKQPGIHVGPNVLAMEERGIRPKSRPQITLDGRVIDWPKIDQGRTRLDRLAELEAANDHEEKERGGKGKGQDGAPALAGEVEQAKPAITPLATPAQEPQGAAPAARTDTPADVLAPTSEATQRPAQEAPGASLPRDQSDVADRAPDVSRLRLAIDRARERLEALGTRLDQAFHRFKERLLDQGRQGGEPEKASRSRHLDAWRKREAPPETGPDQLRRTIDLWRRDQIPDRGGPER